MSCIFQHCTFMLLYFLFKDNKQRELILRVVQLLLVARISVLFVVASVDCRAVNQLAGTRLMHNL